jgi:hypothetical protein
VPPTSGIIDVDKQFIYTSKPDVSIDVKDTSKLNKYSVNCVDSIYNIKDLPSKENVESGEIETHLLNDFT